MKRFDPEKARVFITTNFDHDQKLDAKNVVDIIDACTTDNIVFDPEKMIERLKEWYPCEMHKETKFTVTPNVLIDSVQAGIVDELKTDAQKWMENGCPCGSSKDTITISRDIAKRFIDLFETSDLEPSTCSPFHSLFTEIKTALEEK